MTTTPTTSQDEGRDVQLLAAQLELLAGVVSGHALSRALTSLLRVVEQVSSDDMMASILLMDEDGRRLRHGAAPSLPDDYNAAIDGVEIGPSVGSCGTAAFRRQQVIVEDIASDPLWADFRELALGAGLQDGTTLVRELEVETGPPLGIGTAWPERSSHLPEDAVLLLYTDGLVETRTWDIDQGTGRLISLLEELPAWAGPDRVLDTALTVLPPGSRGDDVAVLAALVPTLGTSSAGRAVRTLPAQPMSVPLARSWAEGWLAGSQVPATHHDAVLLAMSELVTNAVRQGDGPVRVALQPAEHAVTVEVFDSGHRMPISTEPDLDSTGGRGLMLVESMCEEWGVREELDGKTVWAWLSWS